MDLGNRACPMCTATFELDTRPVVFCPCRRTVLHSACAASAQGPLRPGLQCSFCMQEVETPTRHSAGEHISWAIFVMDSVMAPLRQAVVLENPRDHEVPFWSQAISGTPYSDALDPNEVLPPVSEQQRQGTRPRRGPIALQRDLQEDSATSRVLSDLNDSQRQACTQALSLEQGVVLVQGPPGTGKTKTIASLVVACAANSARVLTCGPTNVAAMEIAKRTWDMVEQRRAGCTLRMAQICIVASEDRVGVGMDHPLSVLMLDHRKKRVKRVAKAGLRELVFALRDVLENPRQVFKVWRRLVLEGTEVTLWQPHAARICQTKKTQKDLERAEDVKQPPKEDVPADTDEACRNFLVEFFEAVEEILKVHQEHLTTSLPQLPLPTDEGADAHGQNYNPRRKPDLLENLKGLQQRLHEVLWLVKAIRTLLQRGTVLQADEESPWQNFTPAASLQAVLVHWMEACHEVAKVSSEELRELVLAGAQAIFATTTVAGRNKVWTQKIETVIVDESCQCKELETMVVMRRHVQRLILVGDPEQLPSTVMSKKAKEMGFDRSLFERLVDLGNEKHTLARQYRMLPQIAEFPNNTFYNGQVVNDEIVMQLERQMQDIIHAPDQDWNFDTAIRLFDTGPGPFEERDFTNMSTSNPYEAEMAPRQGKWMGKKSGTKAAEPAAPILQISTQEAFLQTLRGEDLLLARATGCSGPADLEREKQKKKEREKKAQEAQKHDLWQQEKKRQWEKEEEKKAREKAREENKWKKQLEEAKQRAFKEGVKQGEWWADQCWVQLEGGLYKEIQGDYFCTLCSKQLNDNTLEAHIASDAHKRKTTWALDPGQGAAAVSMLALPATSATSAARPAPVPQPSAALEQWQEIRADGLVVCKACNKVVDENHIQTDDHKRRLQSWFEQETLRKSGYEAPELPYLAWVPCDPSDPSSERWKKCLLCQKWVQDDFSHTGTADKPQGSKDHMKNLRNHMGTLWYEENVLKVRRKYHPEPTVRTVSAAKASPPPAAPWANYAAKVQASPYPAPDTRAPSAEVDDVEAISLASFRSLELCWELLKGDYEVVKLLTQFFRANESDRRLSVGIIAPYNGQVRLIKDRINGEKSTVSSRKLEKKVKLVKTVDGFQGNEQDIIVISTVRSNLKGQLGFVSDHRRLNVAITRARFRLWVIGDLQTLANDEMWANFIKFCQMRRCTQLVPDERSQLERNLDRVVAQANGGPPAPRQEPPGRAAAQQRQAANAAQRLTRRIATEVPMRGDEMGAIWSSFFLQQLVSTISAIQQEAHRLAVVKKISQILKGEEKAWRLEHVRDGKGHQLWQMAVEETPVGGGYLIWWLELNAEGMQVVVLADLVSGNQLAQARARAASYLRTFSDEYLEKCISRKVEDKIVMPGVFSEEFPKHRQHAGEQVREPDAEAQDSLPVSLEKRYVMKKTELDFLVKHTLKSVQLPYHLDADEQIAFRKALHEVVFLLGRSGSGKTSVLVHSLFRASCQERQRRQEEGSEDEALLLLLVTRSPVLADSIRKLFAQMQAGPAGGFGGTALEETAGIELGVVREEERRQFRPPPSSLEPEVFSVEESPVITSWDSLLLMLDKSVKGEPFFRPPRSRVARAAARRHRNGALGVEERFENLSPEEGLFDMEDDHLPYEEFEVTCGPKLLGAGPLDKKEGDSLFSAYREFLTVIAGSPRAARASLGCLSKEEYVKGKGPDGKSLPEVKESAFRNSEISRERVYRAFEIYKKFKQDNHRYDCTDVARHILTRAEKYGLKETRSFAGVFIDEVQDLLPVELLLLNLVSSRPEGFVFAGDTAQTISKGVEFRFESIRRLYFEEFLGEKLPEVQQVQIKLEQCSLCNKEMRMGGRRYVCGGKYHSWLVCGDKCHDTLTDMTKKLWKGCTKGLKCKLEHANANSKLPCPMPQGGGHCGLAMTWERVAAAAEVARIEFNGDWADVVAEWAQTPDDYIIYNQKGDTIPLLEPGNTYQPAPDEFPLCIHKAQQPEIGRSSSSRAAGQTLARNAWTEVPDITFLRQNHRSTHSILELAAAILDIIMGLFPEKIDKLPRETSKVKSSTPPVILNRMSWEEAQKTIFASSSSTNAVLEFGAKQVVLVWSEEKKREMKQKLQQSLVMTINECKGLEFFDVLLVDPFSDMGQATNSSQATQLWNLVYGFMDKQGLQVAAGDLKRAVEFSADRHGLLCSWLKTLYVGVTRARKRVWMLESSESGQAVVSYLKELGVAKVCNTGDDASGLASGFADTSTGQEWFEQGLRLFRVGNFSEAHLCFSNAELSNIVQGTPWKLLAGAQDCRRPPKQDFLEAGAKYVKLAEWLEVALGDSRKREVQDLALEEPELAPTKARQKAAESFLEGNDLVQAGREFEASGCFRDAAECAEELKKFDRAGQMYSKAGEELLALKAFQRGEFWEDFAKLAAKMAGPDAKLPASAVDVVIMACRELAKSLQRKDLKDKPKHMRDALKTCIGTLPEEEQDVFLQDLNWQELRLEVLEARKRFDDCAAIALEIRQWAKARQYYRSAKNLHEVNWLELLERLCNLLGGGLLPNLVKLDTMVSDSRGCRLFAEEDMKTMGKVQDSKASSKKEASRQKHIIQTLRHLQEAFLAPPKTRERSRGLREAWASCKELKALAPGYALRLSSFVLVATQKDFKGGKDAKIFEQLTEGFSKCLKELQEMRKDWQNKKQRSSERRSLQDTGMSEWLLAERPEAVRPKFLVLTDCQPQSESRQMNISEMARVASQWSYVLEASLCCAWLELCKDFATSRLPCWSKLAETSCRHSDDECPYLHSEQDSASTTLAASQLHSAATQTSEVLRRKELADARVMLGNMFMDALGGSERWKKLQELPQQSLNFLVARLKSLVPDSPARSLDADLEEEEVIHLAHEAARTQLQQLKEKHRPPDLQEALSVLALLPFMRIYQRESRRMDLLEYAFLNKAREDSKDMNPVTMLVQSTHSASQQKEGRVHQFFTANWSIMAKLWNYWGKEKDRKERFFPLKPSSVFYVLERVVVWASVLLTQFDHLMLPQSFVQAHLTGAQSLAREAAEFPWEDTAVWKAEAKQALKNVVDFIAGASGILYWDFSLYQWLEKREASVGEAVLRMFTLVAACAANDKEVRSHVINVWNNCLSHETWNLCGKADGLPASLVRLMLFLPMDSQTTGREILTPWANSLLSRLGDPLLRLYRTDWGSKAPMVSQDGRIKAPKLQKSKEEAVWRHNGLRPEVKKVCADYYHSVWRNKMRAIRLDTDEEKHRWDAAALLRARTTKPTQAKPKEAEAAKEAEQKEQGAEEVPEEVEEEVEQTGQPQNVPENVQMGPSSNLEKAQLDSDSSEKILEKKTRDRVLQHAWAAWAELVSDAKAEAETAEVREQQEAEQFMRETMPLDGTDAKAAVAKKRILYRALVLPIRRRHAEEQQRMQDLVKCLDSEVALKHGLPPRGKSEKEHAKELASKARTQIGKLQKLAQDFLRQVTKVEFPSANAESQSIMYWVGREKLFGIYLRRLRPKTAPKDPPPELPELLRCLGLEHFLCPAWIFQQLQRRAGRTCPSQGAAPRPCGARRLWDPRASWRQVGSSSAGPGPLAELEVAAEESVEVDETMESKEEADEMPAEAENAAEKATEEVSDAAVEQAAVEALPPEQTQAECEPADGFWEEASPEQTTAKEEEKADQVEERLVVETETCEKDADPAAYSIIPTPSTHAPEVTEKDSQASPPATPSAEISAVSEEKRAQKAQKHSRKRQQRQENKEEEGEVFGEKWCKVEKKHRTEARKYCEQMIKALDTIQKKSLDDTLYDLLSAAVENWHMHCQERLDHDREQWNKKSRKIYDDFLERDVDWLTKYSSYNVDIMERLRAPGERNGTYAAHLGCEIISSQHEQLGEILYGNEDEGDEDADSEEDHVPKLSCYMDGVAILKEMRKTLDLEAIAANAWDPKLEAQKLEKEKEKEKEQELKASAASSSRSPTSEGPEELAKALREKVRNVQETIEKEGFQVNYAEYCANKLSDIMPFQQHLGFLPHKYNYKVTTRKGEELRWSTTWESGKLASVPDLGDFPLTLKLEALDPDSGEAKDATPKAAAQAQAEAAPDSPETDKTGEQEAGEAMAACDQCQEMVPKKMIKKHRKKDCSMRIVTCELCSDRMNAKLLEPHMEKDCEGREVQCKTCGEKFAKRKLLAHQQECPQREVLCPRATHGCCWTGPAVDLQTHLQQCQRSQMWPTLREREAPRQEASAPSRPQAPAPAAPAAQAPAPAAPAAQAPVGAPTGAPLAKPAKASSASASSTSASSARPQVPWTSQQVAEAREFAARFGLEIQQVRSKLDSLTPPQRELIMGRFLLPEGQKPYGKLVNFVDSCEKGGWKFCQTEEEWHRAQAKMAATKVPLPQPPPASVQPPPMEPPPAPVAKPPPPMDPAPPPAKMPPKAAPGSFGVKDAIAKAAPQAEVPAPKKAPPPPPSEESTSPIRLPVKVQPPMAKDGLEDPQPTPFKSPSSIAKEPGYWGVAVSRVWEDHPPKAAKDSGPTPAKCKMPPHIFQDLPLKAPPVLSQAMGSLGPQKATPQEPSNILPCKAPPSVIFKGAAATAPHKAPPMPQKAPPLAQEMPVKAPPVLVKAPPVLQEAQPKPKQAPPQPPLAKYDVVFYKDQRCMIIGLEDDGIVVLCNCEDSSELRSRREHLSLTAPAVPSPACAPPSSPAKTEKAPRWARSRAADA
ncbi:unnamed protein product [Effrenium voratum]|nr:unnamed protein product [Effrenium voratum]